MRKSNNDRNNGNYNSKPVSSARCSTFHNASTGDWFGKGKKYTSPVFFATIVAFAFSAIFSATSFFTQSAYATTLTLSVSDNITATALPTSASGTTAVSDTTATNISISTDNAAGYTLSLASSSSSAPALTGTTSSSNTIPSITTQTATLDSFISGTWGYKPTKKVSGSWTNLAVTHGSTSYTSGYYLPGPTSTADTIDVTDAANSTANEYNIAVGAKIDTSTAIDSYTGSFTVTAVANEVPLYMQDVADWADTEIPNIGDSVQAVDNRDNKLYWVTRLKTSSDGSTSEVWMTQNLDYDISSSSNTISNLDGTSGTWTSSSTYSPQATSTTVFSDESATGTYSYDPGSKYLPSGTGTATDITCTSASNGGENCHYHLGNYYQWNAATAGTGGTITSTDATASICPTGWRLPTSNSYTANYSFGKLTNAYGITSSSSGSSDAALLTSPLWFVRGGFVYGNRVQEQGTNGLVWSSKADSIARTAYDLYFSSSSAAPSGGSNRYNGLSVRCVAIKMDTWDKYNVDSSTVTTYAESKGSSTSTWSVSRSNARSYYYGTSYTFDSSTGTYTVNQTTKPSSTASCSTIGSTGYYFIATSTSSATKTGTTMYKLSSGSGSSTCSLKRYTYTTTSTTETVYSKGSISYGTVTAEEGTYPDNGTPDNTYWYVKQTKCNPNATSISSAVCMQDMNSSVKDSMTTGTAYQLTDKRDNEVYYIAKLADGNVWMLDNLRLGGTSTITLTSSNTNIADDYTLPASGTAYFKDPMGYIIAAINTDYKDTTTTSYGSGSGKIGVYYNFCAASAGTICTSLNSSDASYDICPKGWRLPTGGSSGEYQTLYTAYSSDASSFLSALSTPLSGDIYNGSASGQGTYGEFWSSTRYSDTYMYDTFVYSSNALPANYDASYVGRSMRCVSQ